MRQMLPYHYSQIIGLLLWQIGRTCNEVEKYIQLFVGDAGDTKWYLKDLFDIIRRADVLGSGATVTLRLSRGLVWGLIFEPNRSLDYVLIQPDYEYESVQVEEQLHRLEYLKRVQWQAAIEVVNEHDNPSLALLCEVVE